MRDGSCSCAHCCNQPCTGRVPIFSSLDPDELARVGSLIVKKQHAKGEMLILEGASLESLVIINSGRVKAFKYTYEGKEQILYIFSSGDFLGEKDLLRNRQATYNVEAIEKTDVCMIRKNDFRKLLREYPEIALKIMEELCGRLDKLENAIESMGAKNVEARIGIALLEFAGKYGKEHPKGILVELPLTREGIANYIGLARETVSRKMSALQDEGVIEMIGNKRVIIMDKKALEELTQ
jgi:CRP-like cAMP-binding protein